MGETFENRNLEGVVFRNVNLRGAVFEDVNLGGASIRKANLKDFSIEDAYVEGLTIFGLRVDLLIEAEFDRRDAERVRLRMADPHDPKSVWRVMKRLDEVRDAFQSMLRSEDPGLLATRPSPEQWSAVEIVRHLVFAEDLYLNRWIFRNDEPWIKLGLLPAFLAHVPKYSEVGDEPTEDLETVLATWEALHACARGYIADVIREKLERDTSDVDFGQGTVGQVLQGMAQHDLRHIREVERVIATLSKRGGSAH